VLEYLDPSFKASNVVRLDTFSVQARRVESKGEPVPEIDHVNCAVRRPEHPPRTPWVVREGVSHLIDKYPKSSSIRVQIYARFAEDFVERFIGRQGGGAQRHDDEIEDTTLQVFRGGSKIPRKENASSPSKDNNLALIDRAPNAASDYFSIESERKCEARLRRCNFGARSLAAVTIGHEGND